MFTGLIESVGHVTESRAVAEGRRMTVQSTLAAGLRLGDSIAVNGVCLTVVHRTNDAFEAELSPETVRVTTLGGLPAGAAVNLERPLGTDGRLGGHFVLGHVDGIGRLERVQPQAEFSLVTFAFDAHLGPYVVPKGSIAIDGISLTVAALRDDVLDVQVVPYTWSHTNLGAAAVGAAVNLECDIIGKYVVKALRARE